MKFKDCFIDEEGNIWKSESLRRYSKDLPIEEFDISYISMDEVLRWKLVNVRDYLNHFNRVLNADLEKPIIRRADGYVMNGWHRILKALSKGIKVIPSKRFITNPPPDFISEEDKDNA